MMELRKVLTVAVPIVGIGVLAYALRTRAAPPPTKPPAPKVTLTFRAVAVSRGEEVEVKVPVKGLYPEGEFETPFDVQVDKDKVATFIIPLKIEHENTPYIFDRATNIASYTQVGNEVRIDVIADEDKEVTIYYAEKEYVARWVREGSFVHVYDAYWYEKGGRKYIGLEVKWSAKDPYTYYTIFNDPATPGYFPDGRGPVAGLVKNLMGEGYDIIEWEARTAPTRVEIRVATKWSVYPNYTVIKIDPSMIKRK